MKRYVWILDITQSFTLNGVLNWKGRLSHAYVFPFVVFLCPCCFYFSFNFRVLKHSFTWSIRESSRPPLPRPALPRPALPLTAWAFEPQAVSQINWSQPGGEFRALHSVLVYFRVPRGGATQIAHSSVTPSGTSAMISSYRFFFMFLIFFFLFSIRTLSS